MVEHARLEVNGHPRHIAVEDERRMLLVQAGAVGSEMLVSTVSDDTCEPFSPLRRIPLKNIDIHSLALIGSNMLGLFDGMVESKSLKIFEFI